MVIEVYNSVQGAAFFRRLIQEWRGGGARVIAHQAISESDYRARRGAAGRLLLRWRMYGGYALTCWREAAGNSRGEVMRVVTTNPFFAPALVNWSAGKRGKTINLLYDLFPDALIQAGTIRPHSFLARRCAAITRRALRDCSATVFLGERLQAHAEKTYGSARRSVVIPVGADGIPFRNFPPRLLGEKETPGILYSGQMGNMHETETVGRFLMQDPVAGVSWTFHASGSGCGRMRQATERNEAVTWGAPLDDILWQQQMKRSHVALVTIAPGAEKVVMPSKTYSAMVAGQAILAVCRRESDLADLVGRHDCGWVVEPGDVASLRRVISTIASDRDSLWRKRKNSFEAGHACYDMTPVAEEWKKLFGELGDDKGAMARAPAHLQAV